ncbi:MAG TPA: 16S rRNA (adenine(1518)-N(6)/adenine(1519)-N(6))-dimethyltransferase RsmA [Candidatus Paceibacterota bacterium]|nr:16S rRNA (adenine(1518)-N(6)/adenine(1519)-N(6))-dimethyltransferase RsmA [Candidatus Paceibacterota bacterium]
MIHKAKKSLGQNFLKSHEALLEMCRAGDVNDKDIILEIGPGKGALTEKLLQKANKVIAVEKDRDLIELLSEKFADEIKSGKFILLNEDILDIDISSLKNLPLTPSLSGGGLPPLIRGGWRGYKVIANIPYNITGAIFKKFLSDEVQPERMVMLVQKEVEERIVAQDGKESILSLSVKAYGTPKYIMKVHKRFFSPSPKVDSAIVSITNISRKNFKTKEEEEIFFTVVKAGFAHKRKILRKNLENIKFSKGNDTFNISQIDEILKKEGIDPKTRAEDIKIETWLSLAQKLAQNI